MPEGDKVDWKSNVGSDVVIEMTFFLEALALLKNMLREKISRRNNS